jgi:hypothetical protein
MMVIFSLKDRLRLVRSWSSIRTDPLWGSNNLNNREMRVDFPEPLEPINTTNWLAGISKDSF